MTFILVGVSLFLIVPLLVLREYGNLDSESFESWLANQPLQNFITYGTIQRFGLLLLLFGLFKSFAIWR